MSERIKPIFSLFGSKYRMMRHLLPLVPAHHTYVEPFCGTAAMLMAKKRSYVEIINDLNDDIVNLFRILREPDLRKKLIELVELTPFSRKEYENSYYPCEDHIEKARRFLVRSNLGRGGKTKNKTGWKNGITEFRTIHVWNKIPERITVVAQRLKHVQIDCRPAMELIERTDTTDTFYFLDPPYPKQTLGQPKEIYKHYMGEKEHKDLIELIIGLKGKILITMRENPIYDKLLEHKFIKHEVSTVDCNHQPKRESIYMNYHVYGPLFVENNSNGT